MLQVSQPLWFICLDRTRESNATDQPVSECEPDNEFAYLANEYHVRYADRIWQALGKDATRACSVEYATFIFVSIQGHESVDLLQCRQILPPQGIEVPQIRLKQEHFNVANCNPDIFRCTMTRIPETNGILQKSRLPLGILIHPFKDLTVIRFVLEFNFYRDWPYCFCRFSFPLSNYRWFNVRILSVAAPVGLTSTRLFTSSTSDDGSAICVSASMTVSKHLTGS